MLKKIVSLALAMVCASNLVMASISKDEAAMLAGKEYAVKMIQAGKTAEVAQLLDDAANGLSTPSLENGQKAIWFCAGVATVLAGLGLWYGVPKAWGKVKAWRAERAAKAEAAKEEAAKEENKEEVKEGETKDGEAKDGEAEDKDDAASVDEEEEEAADEDGSVKQ